MKFAKILISALAVLSSACSTTREEKISSGPPKLSGSIPGLPVDVDYDDLTAEQKAKAVTSQAPLSEGFIPPWPIGGWESLNKMLRLPFASVGEKNKGTVLYEFILDKQGHVKEAEIVEGFRKDIDEMVLRALYNTRFKPATKNGVPVATKLRHSFEIHLPVPNQPSQATPARAAP